MPLPEFTRDEQYLRSWLLATTTTQLGAIVGELPYLLPALFIAGVSLLDGAHNALWLGFAYLLVVYVWRIGSVRWTCSFRSLIEKYEHRIAELERASS